MINCHENVTELLKPWWKSLIPLSCVLWAPCGALSVVFFLNDHLYRLTVNDASSTVGMSGAYREIAGQLEGPEGFRCSVEQPPWPGDPDQREPLLVALESAQGEPRWRRLQVGYTSYLELLVWVEGMDFALLRRGTNLDREYSRVETRLQDFHFDQIKPYCRRQRAQQALNEPPLAPIALHGKLRSILLDAASRIEAATRQYEEVRPWVLAFFLAWIAYSVFGFVGAIYLVRTSKHVLRDLWRRSTGRGTAPTSGGS